MFTKQIQQALQPYRGQLPAGFLDTLTGLLGNCVAQLDHRGPIRVEASAPPDPSVAVDADERDQFAAFKAVNNAGIVEGRRIRHGWAGLFQGPVLMRAGRLPGGLAAPPAFPLLTVQGMVHASMVKPCDLDLSCMDGYSTEQTQLLTGTGLQTIPNFTIWRWDGSAWEAVFSLPPTGYSAIEPTGSGSSTGEIQATENLVRTEWRSPTVSATNGMSAVPWLDTDNIFTDDSTYATCTGNTGGSGTLQTLYALDYGFEIPSGATVKGIEFEVQRKADGAGGFDLNANAISSVGPILGDNAADAGEWATGEETIVYGGPAELFGKTWSPAAVNDSGFGLTLQPTYLENLEYAVDHVRCRVFYTM